MMRIISFILGLLLIERMAFGGLEHELRVGRGFHAFDHLGNIGEQADAAAASGINIIYATGIGGMGYDGLPPATQFTAALQKAAAYNQSARKKGVRVILGYVCATSIVKLDKFNANWSAEFRKQFKTPPSEWRQVGRDGKPLPSWYGGDYQPACMNNPDWLAYEKFVVREQLSCDHDGIFFDNPTVHPKGCYCRFCMERFTVFLRESGRKVADGSVEAMRQLADKHPAEFMRFRCTIARDFLAEIRRYARKIDSHALITCNNSLNSPDALFSQARTYGYNIYEKTRAEDLIVVEDMSHQPRLVSGGRTLEYGPTYRQLAAISHGKPIVAVTIAEGDYHTPPNLVRLAMAEAAAHEASYLAWPTWPAEQRARMASAIRPQAEWLRANEEILNDTKPRADVLLLLPMQRFTETNRCVASELAAALTARNAQYRVVAEDELAAALKQKSKSRPALVVESKKVLDPKQKARIADFQRGGGATAWADEPDWVSKLSRVTRASAEIEGPATLRAVVRDQKARTMVHLYNLAIERLSSFEDRVHPAGQVTVRVRVPFTNPHSVTALTADAPQGKLPFTIVQDSGDTWVQVELPKIEISTILVIER